MQTTTPRSVKSNLYTPCLQCRNPQNHRSGRCGPCRSIKCRACGHEFMQTKNMRSVCSPCERLRADFKGVRWDSKGRAS